MATTGVAELRKTRAHDKRAQALEAWADAALGIFPRRSNAFFKAKDDPFGNPIGHLLATELPRIFDSLMGDDCPASVTGSLDRVMEILCIQGVPPSKALAFIPRLKHILASLQVDALATREPALCDRIDALLLLAFDSYARQQARIAEIRVQETRRQVSTLMRINRSAWETPAAPASLSSEEGSNG
jgi:hypothetical protein